jgi:hypothetical protein
MQHLLKQKNQSSLFHLGCQSSLAIMRTSGRINIQVLCKKHRRVWTGGVGMEKDKRYQETSPLYGLSIRGATTNNHEKWQNNLYLR